MAKAGRRPGPTTTSDDILAAARTLFAERGYHATTVRAIAAAAGVNPALVHHFFGTKEQVFLAAVAMPFNPAAVLPTLIAAGPRVEFPERLVRFFVRAWRSPETGPALRSALRGVLGTAEGSALLRRFGEEVLLPAGATGLGVPVRSFAVALSHLVGFAVTGSIVGVAPLAEADEDELVALYTPGIAALLTPEP